ncbi:MAG: hypothetical protein NTX85_03405 [Candidatus Nomurabacteria bacterium]|nr:hypothetical protein [Candidatus Nomurabacteria bacterium]
MFNFLLILIQSTVFQTVIAGVLVFVLSQIFQDYILKPRQKYKDTVSKIDHQLNFYLSVILNDIEKIPKEISEEIENKIRALSCDLETDYKRLVFKNIKSKNIRKAADNLCLLVSLSWYICDAKTRREEILKIRKLLKINEIN